jgi:serine/threonine-protein kinase
VLRDRLGRYQLITKLAVGGMAEVYLARNGELAGFRTLVVVKKVLPHLASQPEFINMFLDEARIASLLDHPNVVRIVEVGRSNEEFFLAMELVQGKPLSSLIRRGRKREEHLAPKIAAWIVAQAAAGLHHAHELADAEGRSLMLVHRDVSPQNVLVSFEGAVKVIDFGIARALGRLTDTAAGGTKGKVAYMAPEQGTGDEVGPWTDIFSLGVVLWETLCGQRLFARDNDVATMRAILDDPVPLPSTVADIPPALEAIVMKALARDPAERFASARAMGEALERCTFQMGGTSINDVTALMKEYFAEDRAKWMVTTRLALDVEAPAEATPVRSMKLSQTSVPFSFSLTALTSAGRPMKRPGARRRLALAAAIATAACLLVLALVRTGMISFRHRVSAVTSLVPSGPPPSPSPPVTPPALPVTAPPPPPPSAERLPWFDELYPAERRVQRQSRPGHAAPSIPRLDNPAGRRPNPF